MSDPVWELAIGTFSPVVTRVWPDGKQESRLVSAFTPDDPDYVAIMALVAAGELTIAPAEGE